MKLGPVTLKFAPISNHGSEVLLLGLTAGGVLYCIIRAIDKGLIGDGFDIAAFLLVLQRIIDAVQKRWETRGQDAKEMELARTPGQPLDVNVTNPTTDPVPTAPQKET